MGKGRLWASKYHKQDRLWYDRTMDAYITIQEAARVAGYASATNLHAAARLGRLRTIKPGPRARLTTRPWLDEYLQALRNGDYDRGRRRGPRKGQDASGTAGE